MLKNPKIMTNMSFPGNFRELLVADIDNRRLLSSLLLISGSSYGEPPEPFPRFVALSFQSLYSNYVWKFPDLEYFEIEPVDRA